MTMIVDTHAFPGVNFIAHGNEFWNGLKPPAAEGEDAPRPVERLLDL